MNLTTKKILLSAFCMFAFLWSVHAQQLYNFNVEKVSLEEALANLKKQTGQEFVYQKSLLNDAPKVSLQMHNATLGQILDKLLEATGLTYEKVNDVFVIRKSDPRKQEEKPQPMLQKLQGTVQDDIGEPLPGAVVTVKGGAKKPVSADIDGKFELTDIPANATLIISFMGYDNLEFPVNGRAIINVSLSPSAKQLDEVVVTGYQTISREKMTGAYNVVKSEDMEKSHSSNLSTALLGTTAGMQGKENVDGTIEYTIRGITSLYANASPLIVVDGFPVSTGFQDINPQDVESVSVLKDAAAASIWGARSANGVIVVTTKKAKEKGRISVEVNAMVRIGEKLDLNTALTTASSSEQVDYEKMAYDKGWIRTNYTGAFSNLTSAPLTLAKEAIWAYKRDQITETRMNELLEELRNVNNRGQIKDELLQNPLLQQYNISISSAMERSQNYLSAMYENTLNNFKYNSSDRWRINYNNQTKVFSWLSFNFGANLHLLSSNNSGATLSEIAALSPYEMLLNSDGSYGEMIGTVNREQLATIPSSTLPYSDWSYNLLREVRNREFTSNFLNTRLQAGLTFKIIEGLTFDTKIQYEYNKGDSRNLYGEETYYARNRINTYIGYNQTSKTRTAQFIPNGAILGSTNATDKNYVWRNQLNYNATFKSKHAIAFLAGAEISDYLYNSTTNPLVYGYNPETNTSAPLPYGANSKNAEGQTIKIVNITGNNVSTIDGATTSFGYRNDRFVSFYANASYTFSGKYSISGSARSDASNLITDNPKYRWAPLWSVGGLWNAHKENFMQSVSTWLNRLNLRLTYGFNGNVDRNTSPYTLLTMRTTPSAITNGYTSVVSSYGNPLLRWEKTSTINGGIDFSLLGNILFGSIDIYSKQGKDILGNISLPTLTGTGSQKVNAAEISNKGIEVELGINTKIFETGLNFITKLNYAYNENEITKLYFLAPPAYDMLDGWNSDKGYVEGYPVHAMWSYTYLGMKDDGAPYVVGPEKKETSMNNQAKGTGTDFLNYEGPSVSPHSMGWSGSISGYGLTFNFLVIGNFGGHFRNPVFLYPTMDNSKMNISKYISDVYAGSDRLPSWSLPNNVNMSYWSQYVPYINTMVESSSFIKLKELTLEYKLPQKWMQAVGIPSAKIYTQARDLGCLWVANSKGYDPEWLPGSVKPNTTFAFGINLNF